MKKLLTAAVLSLAALAHADSFKVDPVHSSVLFRAHHAGAGYVWGRFNEAKATFVLDADPAKSSFVADIPVESLDSNNDKRDAHLKSPDWFNFKQYPNISFKSTKVEKVDDKTLSVTGDLTLHGVTRSVSVPVELAGRGEFPKGTFRAGIEATFTVKMSDYGIKGMPGAVADEVKLIVAFECVKE
jgi:polyisoprenoid-binding protein YceI